jgi:hypothetical protein
MLFSIQEFHAAFGIGITQPSSMTIHSGLRITVQQRRLFWRCGKSTAQQQRLWEQRLVGGGRFFYTPTPTRPGVFPVKPSILTKPNKG